VAKDFAVDNPKIIQGGMGAGVSSWQLARAVSRTGQLGVVSGTALDQILARRLQDGDCGGAMRHALAHFPFPQMAERVWQAYYISGGKRRETPYRCPPMPVKDSPRELSELCLVANFIEVYLAREGHGNAVGINYLEKVQMLHLCSVYGAMLAGVDYVLMGAGIPAKIPGVLDRLARHEPATYPLQVAGAQPTDETHMQLAPADFMEFPVPPLTRPRFFAIVSSSTLALAILKRANGKVDGFVVEGPTAGGHNAPPRGKHQFNDAGEPIYGVRDHADLSAMRALGLPFWLAGGYGSPEKLQEALAAGAAGIQVGTAFAFCVESGLREDCKRTLIKEALAATARVVTDPLSSPTGFPFKTSQLAGSASEAEVYSRRARICDVGYLREAYRTANGDIGYRCSAEPVSTYLAKGGQRERTVGKKCLCNALLANIGYAQVRPGNQTEPCLVTCGDDLARVDRFLTTRQSAYSAADVIAILLGGAQTSRPSAELPEIGAEERLRESPACPATLQAVVSLKAACCGREPGDLCPAEVTRS
jgi:nitronate monooxygenase